MDIASRVRVVAVWMTPLIASERARHEKRIREAGIQPD